MWEAENKDGMMFGYTENYIKVQTPYNPDLINQCTEVDLVMLNPDGIVEVQIL